MTDLERVETLPDRQHHLSQILANHTLWVCFLDREGYESFTTAHYTDERVTLPRGVTPPDQAEISTIQFWHENDRVTILPTGYSDDGSQLYMTVEALLEHGELPALAARSLARRLKKQPYRDDPNAAIYPLLKLLPLADTPS